MTIDINKSFAAGRGVNLKYNSKRLTKPCQVKFCNKNIVSLIRFAIKNSINDAFRS